MSTNDNIREYISRYDKFCFLDYMNLLGFRMDDTEVKIPHTYNDIKNVIIKQTFPIHKVFANNLWINTAQGYLDSQTSIVMKIDDPISTYLGVLACSEDQSLYTLTPTEYTNPYDGIGLFTKNNDRLLSFTNNTNISYNNDDKITNCLKEFYAKLDVSPKLNTMILSPDNYLLKLKGMNQRNYATIVTHCTMSLHGTITRRLYDHLRTSSQKCLFYPLSNYSFLIPKEIQDFIQDAFVDIVKELTTYNLEQYFIDELCSTDE